jgi:RimJ/RimL family protein N-acetyltransferase
MGYISATRRNEIGIVLMRDFRGRGYGSQALMMFMENYQPLAAVPSERRGAWVANVAPGNHRSHALFRKLGGRVIQHTYEL